MNLSHPLSDPSVRPSKPAGPEAVIGRGLAVDRAGLAAIGAGLVVSEAELAAAGTGEAAIGARLVVIGARLAATFVHVSRGRR